MPKINEETVRSLLAYDPDTGLFTWKRRLGDTMAIKRWNNCYASKLAGSIKTDGYVTIRLLGRGYQAHRLAWLHVHGRWPREHIDHINGDTSDNRLINLRECSNAENHQNVVARRNNRTGILGVDYCKSTNRWRAQIRADGKKVYLGSFETSGEASAAYQSAKQRYHTFNPQIRADGAGTNRDGNLAMPARLTEKQQASLAVLDQGLIFMAGTHAEKRRLRALLKKGLVANLTTTVHDPIHGPLERPIADTFKITEAGRSALRSKQEERSPNTDTSS